MSNNKRKSISIDSQTDLLFFTEELNGVNVDRVSIYNIGEEVILDKSQIEKILSLFIQYEKGEL